MKKIEESGKQYQDMSDAEYIEGRYLEMANEEYRLELNKIFSKIDDDRLLRYFYIFVLEKLKRVLS